MPRPRLFLSAVSQEWRSLRQRVARLLASQGYDCVSQDDFATGHGELRQWLREQIDGCEGLIQLVGEAYGAEPPEPDPTWGRVSYTQYEFLYARDQGKTTWVLAPGGTCVRDTALDRLDEPDPADAFDPTATVAWQGERRKLQDAYRARLVASNHLRHEPRSDAEVENAILKLRDELAVLHQREEGRWHRLGRLALAIALALGAIGGGGWWAFHHLSADVRQVSVVNGEKIRAHLLATIEDTHRRELAEADALTDWQERQRRREAAEAAHAARLQRIEEVAAAFAEIEGRGGGTEVFQEMRRILAEQGVDEAIAFVAVQKPALLDAARRRAAAAQARTRQDLAPLLQAAALHETKGQADAARALYTEILDIEPTWAEALHQGFGFLVGQGDRSRVYRSLGVALDDYRLAEQWVGRLVALDDAHPEWQRDLSVSFEKIGNVLMSQGDGAGALVGYRKSLEIREALAARDPGNTEWQRDLSVSYNKIGDVLVYQGAGVGALVGYRKSLGLREALAARDPANTGWQRDLAVSHSKIGDVLLSQGDEAGALAAYGKSLEIREALAARDPANTGLQRDLSVSHERIGDALMSQGNGTGALAAYHKDLAIAEALAARDPTNTGLQRDLSVSHGRIGNALVSQGDGAGALAAYRKSLAIAEALAARDQVNAQWQEDLAMSCVKLGNMSALPVAERRSFLQRGLQLLRDLKAAGRLHPNRDWVEEVEDLLADLPKA